MEFRARICDQRPPPASCGKVRAVQRVHAIKVDRPEGAECLQDTDRRGGVWVEHGGGLAQAMRQALPLRLGLASIVYAANVPDERVDFMQSVLPMYAGGMRHHMAENLSSATIRRVWTTASPAP